MEYITSVFWFIYYGGIVITFCASIISAFYKKVYRLSMINILATIMLVAVFYYYDSSREYGSPFSYFLYGLSHFSVLAYVNLILILFIAYWWMSFIEWFAQAMKQRKVNKRKEI